jgi:hypothetical protein
MRRLFAAPFGGPLAWSGTTASAEVRALPDEIATGTLLSYSGVWS